MILPLLKRIKQMKKKQKWVKNLKQIKKDKEKVVSPINVMCYSITKWKNYNKWVDINRRKCSP